MKTYTRYDYLVHRIRLCLLAGAAVLYTAPAVYGAAAVVPNNELPMGGHSVMGGHTGLNDNAGTATNPVMNIRQNGKNGVITWNSFNIGANAVVNFSANTANFNTLNYVNGGNASQIYGTINAAGGTIYVVNPAGVQIGPSAQINADSLYVSNKNLNDVLQGSLAGKDVPTIVSGGTRTDAELMSLGNINAANVTFEGNGRIVIDTERVRDEENKKNDRFSVITDNADAVILGYDAYDGETKPYAGKEKTFRNVKVNGTAEDVSGYMWVEDARQLQAMDTDLGGKYALRNSIDATGTASWHDEDGDADQEGFKPIGVSADGKVTVSHTGDAAKYGFYGVFDGLDYNIFGLTINRGDTDNVGLFGVGHDADINHVSLVGGSITGRNFVGSVAGAAVGHTHIRHATNSTAVTGQTDVGGIVGYSGTTVDNVGAAGQPEDVAADAVFDHLVNMGTIRSQGSTDGSGQKVSNAGGLIGYLYNGNIKGTSYNIGDIYGDGSNVGGLAGHAVLSAIGNEAAADGQVYNGLDVTGAYNVGGIVGNMEGTTVQHAENHGDVHAEGYTTEDYTYHTANTNFDGYYGPAGDKIGGIAVNVANAGGIAGISSNYSTMEDITNSANVTAASAVGTQDAANYTYYTAGNVGGVVGRAEDTSIQNASNMENEVRGAHNIGGIAGYFGGTGRIDNGINNGGNILATGARAVEGKAAPAAVSAGFAREQVRPGTSGQETVIIGNMGGIVGYLHGDDVFISGSVSNGAVHSQKIAEPNHVLYVSQAANTGGIAGKVDRSKTLTLENLKNGSSAAVSQIYNTGDVTGYASVGGIAGMMYNGEVAHSYNLGNINTTRGGQSGNFTVNMGGIAGDTTETGQYSIPFAQSVLYDVYNKGQIGDNTYTYYARHVGGIVGRLSGTVDTAYNSGDIYNGYSVVGGIAGWFRAGTISNSFNTGNITVSNKETGSGAEGSQVGGIAGAVDGTHTIQIRNVYNLGTLRSYQNVVRNNVGGIIGRVPNGSSRVNVQNAYTMGNLYAEDSSSKSTPSGLRRIYGEGSGITLTNVYYIAPKDGSFFTLNDDSQGTLITPDKSQLKESYQFDWASLSEDGTVINKDAPWRIYEGQTTPILNAFLPNTESYFGKKGLQDSEGHRITSVQYGTAYDPMLTIVHTDSDVVFDWNALGLAGEGRLAVYGGGLTLNNVQTDEGTAYYGGLLYTDKALTMNAVSGSGLGFGTGAALYGSSVTLNADGTVAVYGNVTATGEDGKSDIAVTAGDVAVYGTLTSTAKDQTVTIPGVAGRAGEAPFDTLSNKSSAVTNTADFFAVTTTAKESGDITILAQSGDTAGGSVNLRFGNKETGLITTNGDLKVQANSDVFVDSDLALGGSLTLESTGEHSEVVLDITHIGQVQARQGTTADSVTGLSQFMDHFSDANGPSIALNAASGDAKFAVDLWDETAGKYTFEKFGSQFGLRDKFNSMNAAVNGQSIAQEEGVHTNNFMYLWVNSAEQLQGIQTFYKNGLDGGSNDTEALHYNYALKQDINASNLTGYTAIGTGSDGYMGTFDGRGHHIIGLDAAKGSDGNVQSVEHAGIFSQIGASGTVKNVNIYSSTFDGTKTSGAVAGVNEGTIAQVNTFGNTISSQGSAGGIAGINRNGDAAFDEAAGAVDFKRGIYDVEAVGSVIAKGGEAIAGGIAGTNEADGVVDFSYSNSAVTSDGTASSGGLGGVVGYNTGGVYRIDSLGVTNGGDSGSSNVGGIIGINDGTMYNAYNESIISGEQNVGGIIGINHSGKTVSNVVNAANITGTADSQYVGGLIGDNSGIVQNGRNNGEITGQAYVGGLVGINQQGAKMERIVNDSSAAITGDSYVGGIAGKNVGTISAAGDGQGADGPLLVNRGKITGREYVGGVAGSNGEGGVIDNTYVDGALENIKNTVELHVKPGSGDARYFGGVAGINEKGAAITNAMTEADVYADGAAFVGGIAGLNEGSLQGTVGNAGNVIGSAYVGGVAGENKANFDGLTASNTGEVKATGDDGGAGGLFGQNSGSITNAALTNSGIVAGNKGATGGLIGTNTGTISKSHVVNEAGAQVAGMTNVGGLIGDNQGELSGGRDETDGYYKYQVYNNGVITAGTWNDANSNKVVDAGEIQTGGAGEHIGGLVGTNSGTVTAAYNTGAIAAAGSANVGGIAGTNSGTIDQVFSHIMTADKTKEAVQGQSNVGGLVGTNTGIVSNAYSTGGVTGSESSVGTLAGANTGTLENVYGKGTLVGTGNAAKNGYDLSDSSFQQTKKTSYGGYDFAKTWRIYDGSSTPLLKVFLTNLTLQDTAVVDGKELSLQDYLGLTYTGREQDLDIHDLIAKGFLTGPDGMDAPFAAYDSTTAADSALGNGSLLYNTNGQVDAKAYTEWLASAQIGRSLGDSFNPNNLGYDVAWSSDAGKITVDKATLDVTLDDIYRVYGNGQMHSGGNSGRIVPDYQAYLHLAATNGKGRAVDIRGFDDDMQAIRDHLAVADGATAGTGGARQTNDVGNYDWSVTFDAAALGNYKLKDDTSLTVTAAGKSHVTPAALTIHADDLTIPAGMPPQYTGSVSPFVNGDSFGPIGFDVAAGNKSKEYQPGRHAGIIGFQYGNSFYGQEADLSGLFGGNYDIRLEPGTLTVTNRIVPDIYDAPFGRNKDLRERKAEIHFVDGGMEL